MIKLHYLAYGSNLHPLRLIERVPSATVIGVISMPGFSVKFHKKSADLSGKCTLLETGEPNISYGVLYEISADHKLTLDRAEGLGHGYREVSYSFQLNGFSYSPFTYIANASHIAPSLHPYHWYKNLVIAGARYHKFPQSYISELEGVSSIPDPDEKRALSNQALLNRIADFQQAP